MVMIRNRKTVKKKEERNLSRKMKNMVEVQLRKISILDRENYRKNKEKEQQSKAL